MATDEFTSFLPSLAPGSRIKLGKFYFGVCLRGVVRMSVGGHDIRRLNIS